MQQIIYRCAISWKIKGKLGFQKMADLSARRYMVAVQFTYSGIHMSGLISVRQRWPKLTCYDNLFTCLSSFFVLFEFTIIIETDSFTIALQKFMARRGAIWEQNKQNKTNNKTNFVGSNIELQKTMNEMDHGKIKIFFQENYTDSIVRYKKILTKKRNELKRSKTT